MLHYILQVVAFQLIFLIIYDVFLKKETFFNLNRAYLLFTASLSMILPFVKIDEIKTVVDEDFVIGLPEVIIGKTSEQIATIDPQIAMQAGINLESQPFSIWQIVFFTGASIATLVFIVKIFKLYKLVLKNPKYRSGRLLIVSLLNSNRAFSFFHYVFLGESLNIEERTTILNHEKVHVKQKHSLDLLFFELFRIFFWFNPLIYMYQNRIATIHEFIADSKAVKQYSKTQYYNRLLTQTFETQQFSFVNPFFKQSLIKKRIQMLSKSKSKQIRVLKYALLIPLIFIMLVYTASYAQDKKTTSIETFKKSESQELSDQELFNTYYNEVLELRKSNVAFSDIYESYKADNDLYVLNRDDYYKQLAFFKFFSEQSEQEPIKDENGNTILTRFSQFKPYQDYLDYKKTDEAKQSWSNVVKDGVLRFVANDTGNLTDIEEKEFNKKLDLLESDNIYKALLMTSVHGKSTMMIHRQKGNAKRVSRNTESKIINVEESVEVPFAIIDETPTYKFCDSLKTNDERKSCMTKGITNHVTKKFNTDLAKSLGLTGRIRLNVIFKIDQNGFVKDVRARAPHPELEDEAIRVIEDLPQFIPGKHEGKAVNVPYSLPIIFQVNADSEHSKSKDSKSSTESYKALKQTLKDTILNKNKAIPYSVIDEVPLLDSCVNLSSQDEKKKCVSQEVSKFINRNFNLDLASKLNLVGKQRINVLFKIDENGNVTGAKARAPHPDLETETLRVINSLPQFIPGKEDGKPVTVNYSLPIMFQIAPNSSNDKRD